jgi:predicted nucleic acid-binding protein
VGPEPQSRPALRTVVCDTGPLLHLQEAGALDLLPAAGRIAIPPAVHAELAAHDPFWKERRPEWISVEQLDPAFAQRAARWTQAGLLDVGESEALSLAIQLTAGWFLTDDAAARLLAQQQGVEVHGSLGIVLWAAATGQLSSSEAEARLEALARSSLWISARVLAEARTALRQIFA